MYIRAETTVSLVTSSKDCVRYRFLLGCQRVTSTSLSAPVSHLAVGSGADGHGTTLELWKEQMRCTAEYGHRKKTSCRLVTVEDFVKTGNRLRPMTPTSGSLLKKWTTTKGGDGSRHGSSRVGRELSRWLESSSTRAYDKEARILASLRQVAGSESAVAGV